MKVYCKHCKAKHELSVDNGEVIFTLIEAPETKETYEKESENVEPETKKKVLNENDEIAKWLESDI